MASSPKYDLKDATITFKGQDNDESLTVYCQDGGVTWTETRNREYIKNNGRLGEVRDGDEEPLQVSGEFIWERIQGTPELLMKTLRGETGWTSVGAACAPFAVDCEITFAPGCGPGSGSSAGSPVVVLLPEFRFESAPVDSKTSMINLQGKCNAVKPVISDGTEE